MRQVASRERSAEAAAGTAGPTSARWDGIARTYEAADVVRLRGSIQVEHTLATRGAEKLWQQLTQGDWHVAALGAFTGGQATQMVKAGLQCDLPVGLAGRG